MKAKKTRVIYKIGALSFVRKLSYCKQLDEYIKVGVTGSLEELASKIGITESLTTDLLIYMIETLKCPIMYSQVRKTYYYDGEGELKIGFYPDEEIED